MDGKITIPKIFGHITQVLIHKFWVFVYCCKFGIVWRGIKHDMSKFSYTEFWDSVRYYHRGSSPIPRLHEHKKYRPWLHHKGRNDHHSEYWHRYSNGTVFALKMPFDCVLEQVADWLGSTRAYGRNFDFDEELQWLQETTFYTFHKDTLDLTMEIIKGLKSGNLDLKALRKAYES